MDPSEVRERIDRIMQILSSVPPDMHTEELVVILAPILPYMPRAEVVHFRKQVAEKIIAPELLTLLDGNLALREILGNEK